MKNELLNQPPIKIIAVDYLDDGPGPVYVGRGDVNGVIVVFDVCNNECPYLEISDNPEFNTTITEADYIMIDELYDELCEYLAYNVPIFYAQNN